MNNRLKVMAAFAAIYLTWGSTYLAIATTVVSVPPVFMVAVRGLIAGGVLYAWTRWRGGEPIKAREVVAMLPTATLLFGGGYVLVGWAEQYVSSGAAALLNSTTPAWVVLFEWFVGRRARPTIRFTGALALGVIGVAVLVGGAGSNASAILPALACVLASVAWAAGTLRTRMRAHGNPTRDAAVQLLTGGLLLLPFSVAFGETPTVLAGLATTSLLALGYLIVIGSLVGYSAYVFLLHNVSASRVATHSYVNPLIAVVVGAVIAHEELSSKVAVAAVLILVSVFFIVSDRAGAAAAPKTVQPTPRPRIAA